MSSKPDTRRITPGSSHWGAFNAVVDEGRLVGVQPFEHDPDPSPLIHSIPDAVHHHSRVAKPAIREGWLKHGPAAANEGRGGDRYVEVSWDRALDLVASELKRVIGEHGNR